MTPAELAALHRRCFTAPRPYTEDEFAALLAGAGTYLCLAQAGFALGRAVAGEAELLTLAVAPERRRQGTGAALLDRFETEARGRGAAIAFLEVGADNAAARALYARAGYAEVGRRRGYYRAADGTQVDAMIMQKALCDG